MTAAQVRVHALRPGPVTDPTTAAKHTLRAIARRWLAMDAEIKTHEHVLNQLTTELVPDLVAAFGIGADVPAEMLIVAGDNPERIKSEPAFARLCGVAPIPASSGMTTRHRLNPGGHRQANSAPLPGCHRPLAVPPTHPGPTTNAGRLRAGPRPRSSVVSSACWPAKSGATSDRFAEPGSHSFSLLDSYRSLNAMTESIIGLFKTEVIRCQGPWCNRDAVEMATLEWVDWYNNRRLFEALGDIPPAEAESAHYATMTPSESPRMAEQTLH